MFIFIIGLAAIFLTILWEAFLIVILTIGLLLVSFLAYTFFNRIEMKERKVYQFWKYGLFWVFLVIVGFNLYSIHFVWGMPFFKRQILDFGYIAINIALFLICVFIKLMIDASKRRAKEGIPQTMAFWEVSRMRKEMEDMNDTEKEMYILEKSKRHEREMNELTKMSNEKHIKKLQKTTTQMKCPKCYSVDIFVIGENKKDFSFKKAMAGNILIGRNGSMAGFAGEKIGYDCFCGDCKHRFLLKNK